MTLILAAQAADIPFGPVWWLLVIKLGHKDPVGLSWRDNTRRLSTLSTAARAGFHLLTSCPLRKTRTATTKLLGPLIR